VQTIDTSPAAQGSNRKFLYAAVGGISLVLAAWSAPGLAAAHTAVDCDQVPHDLQSLDIGQLAVEAVDLADVSEAPETSDDLTESVSPLLFLTPRVASILQDVFGDSDEAEPAAKQEIRPAPAAERPKPAASPVVDNAGSAELAAPSGMYEHAAILPRFQRQMYRTDI
jgi:hypothetical protein